MKYILQAYTGSWSEQNRSATDIIRKIGEIASVIPVDKVIIGWNINPSIYKEIGTFLRSLNIDMLLWLPVFSEINDSVETDMAIDFFGKPSGKPPVHTDESFEFFCPSSRRNLQNVIYIYNRFFSDCDFSGIFLDRIRTQSFATGISGVLSCGCKRCQQFYQKRGIDLDELKHLYLQNKNSFFNMRAFPMNGEFEFEHKLVQRFFDAKEEIIAHAVKELSQYFKNMGLIVGLDLFAPIISRFVGQHYSKMSKYADFIKPMLYRRTEAPAGIGYEYRLYEKHAPNASGQIKITMDSSFLNTQLEAIKDIPCEKYPGIEAVCREDIVKTDTDYITESLSAIKSFGFDGAVLCWDIMQVPDSYIHAISCM